MVANDAAAQRTAAEGEQTWQTEMSLTAAAC